MKLLKFTGLLLFSILIFGVSYSQDFNYPDVEGRLTDDQRETLEKAETYVKAAEKKIKQAESIESQYSKFKESKKSRKRKKWEKKTWEAKQKRIDAEKRYEMAYLLAYDVYSEVITTNQYYSKADEDNANSLNNNANDKLSDAKSKLSKYKKKTDKKSLEKVKYKKLASDIDNIRVLQNEAIQKQFDAIGLMLQQGNKKLEDQKDNLAWENAKDINTISAYQEYIDDFSKGKFVAQARSKINALKKAAADARELRKNKANKGYTFKVQIAASKTRISNFSLARKYSDVSKISKVNEGGYFKYRVGSFDNYLDAESLKKSLKRKAPGAFIVVFDVNGKQIQVIDEMKK